MNSLADAAYAQMVREKEYARRERLKNPKPADKFMNLINKQYKSAFGWDLKRWSNPDLCFYFDQEWLNEEYAKYSVLLRTIYVYRNARKKGLLKEFLADVVSMSEETGSLVYAVCSPFEIPMNNSTEGFNLSMGKYHSLEYPEYEVVQKKLGKVFRSFGFSTVGNLFGIGDRTNIDLDDFLFYQPEKVNTKFVRKYLESKTSN